METNSDSQESYKIYKLAWEAAAKTQKSGEIPRWFGLNATYEKECVEDSKWRITISLFKRRMLEPGESWKKTPDGSKVLTRTEPKTGENRVVIMYTVPDSDRVKMFEVVVDLCTSEAVVKKAVDLANVDRDSYELFYDA